MDGTDNRNDGNGHRSISCRDPLAEHRLYTDPEAVLCDASGGCPAGTDHCVWIHVEVPASELSDEGDRLDHPGNAPDDPASDHLLFSGAGSSKDRMDRRGRPFCGGIGGLYL